ncbi:MAG: GAF domain-containing sensor histidine kinase [Bryobacteraceae bacterium]
MNFAEKQTSEHAALLAGIAADLVRFDEPGILLENVFRHLSGKTGADFCFCYLVESGKLHLVYAGGLADDSRYSIEWLGFQDGFHGRAAQEASRISIAQIQDSGDPSLAFLKSIGADSLCCYPLRAGKKVLGALSFATAKPAGFGAAELQLQSVLAGEIALALDRILLMAELERTNEALEAARTNLRHANADLEQFTFSASHDLREPLRHLAIYSDLLNARLPGGLNDDCHEYLAVIAASARRIELLVRDLLAYTRAAADGPGSARPVSGNEALAQALAGLSGLIHESNASIHTTDLPSIYVNPPHLVQIFTQLVENAVKYHRSGAAPEVHIFARANDSIPVFCVSDNGIGIAPEYSNRIFGLFKRLHTSEEYEGTGIGLAICQKIVEYYRGRIWVESRAGEGATFCFTLGKQIDGGNSVSASAHLYR